MVRKLLVTQAFERDGDERCDAFVFNGFACLTVPGIEYGQHGERGT